MMYRHSLFENNNQNTNVQLFLALFFTIFTVIALGIDSVFFTSHYFDARQITNVFALLYFSLLFWVSSSELRKLMITMVFLSYIGELIFCNLLGMYDYRTNTIPFYVPFGHAIVYASGYIFSQATWAIKNDRILKTVFILFYILLFLSVGLFLHDIFTLLFGICFFLLLRRKRWQNLYFYIAFCVIFIELVGTYFECWAWKSKTLSIIPTANPPMGAVFFYAGGDVLLAKIVSYWKKSK